MLQALRIPGRGVPAALALLAGLVGGSARGATIPLDPPAQFRAQGEGAVTIAGPYCCGGALLSGRFDAAYELDSAGNATLRHLDLALDDANIIVRDGFLGIFDQRIKVRCGTMGLLNQAAGSTAGVDQIQFAADAVKIQGTAAEEREPDGSCPASSLSLAGRNSGPVSVTHQASSNHVALDATFTVDIEGSPHTMHLTAEGSFRNRPPVAALAFRYPDGGYPQEGCPAFWRWNGQSWELAAEANDPNGLVAGLLSYAGDPDGSWSAADVLTEQWFDTRDGGARERLAHGRDVGPFLFGWGAPHTVELLALDHAGAADATACSFRVVDTRPPAVQPPPPLTVGCSTTGGATAATSPALAAFLAAGSAADLVDGSPTRLPPRRNGADVTPTTLFPADGVARSVQFRFQDDWGNVGSANSSVTVKDVVPPTASVTTTPLSVYASSAMVPVKAVLTGSDACGGPLTYRLVGINSNAPQFDPLDIQGATYGTDDRLFYLRARLAAPGVDRVYKIGYDVIDQAGNATTVTTTFRVRAL